MKKTIFTLVFAAMALATTAQDTVRYPDPWYGYTYRQGLADGELVTDSILNTSHPESHTIFFNEPCGVREGIGYRYYVIPLDKEITRLYGIAVTISETRIDTTNLQVVVYQGWHTSYVQDDVMIEGYFDSVYKVDIATAPLVKQCKFEYDYSLPTAGANYSHCYEIYFDTPLDIVSADSNFFGMSDCEIPPTHFVHFGTDTSYSQYPWHAGYLPYRPYNYSYKLMNIPRWVELNNGYFKYTTGIWGLVFPIVQPRCTAPRCLHVDTCAKPTAIWCADTNADVFQLSTVPYPASPDSGTLVTTADTSFLLPDMPQDSNAYCLYLRKMCTFTYSTTGHTDTVWSAWSDPVVLTGDTTGLGGSQSIADIENSNLTVDITPNPASGMVEVRCSEPMALLELFNAAGDKVFSQQLSTFNFQFSIFNFSSGTYLVRITTPQGVTTRKLVKR